MNSIQTACYCLIASAFMLAGMLVFSLGSQVQNAAYGDQVISRDNFSLMTAPTSANDEALFVLDNASGRLYVYTLDVGRERLELSGAQDLAQVFGRGDQGGGSRRGR